MMTVERSDEGEAKERFELGCGGCSAPEAPMPMVAPSASILWRVWRKRPAQA